MIPVLNFIHLSKEQFNPESGSYSESLRREHNIKSLAFEHKFTYGIWEGIMVTGKPFTGICRSHKMIVQHAKDEGLLQCIIAEDDLKLKPNGWKGFIESLPDEYDIFFGGISGGSVNEETKEVMGASGMFLYCIHSRFYDAFLSADDQYNLDRWLSGTGYADVEKILGRKPVYKVCYPMAAITSDGISYKNGQYVNHDKYFSAYKLMQ